MQLSNPEIPQFFYVDVPAHPSRLSGDRAIVQKAFAGLGQAAIWREQLQSGGFRFTVMGDLQRFLDVEKQGHASLLSLGLLYAWLLSQADPDNFHLSVGDPRTISPAEFRMLLESVAVAPDDRVLWMVERDGELLPVVDTFGRPALVAAEAGFVSHRDGSRSQTGRDEPVRAYPFALAVEYLERSAHTIVGMEFISGLRNAPMSGYGRLTQPPATDNPYQDSSYRVRLAVWAITEGNAPVVAAHIGISPRDISRILLAGDRASFSSVMSAIEIIATDRDALAGRPLGYDAFVKLEAATRPLKSIQRDATPLL